MAEIFLGKPWHWALLVVGAIILWVVGENHLHTSAFNLFTAITFGVGLVGMIALIVTHKDGERVTRDDLEEG